MWGRRARRWGLLLAAAVWTVGVASALETDQYYAWGRELTDATEVLNAKINLEIERALDTVNHEDSGRDKSCPAVARKVVARFRQFIFQDIELWTTNTPLVSRIPQTPEEELAYRQQYLYRITGPLDLGTKVPPSPTIEIDGVRIGTDKLSHFFSEGFMYSRWYRNGLRKGLSPDAAERRALRRGVFYEKTILGLLASGVFSRGDLEANYQGMLFFNGLCETEPPDLVRGDTGWRLARPFDIARYVTPEWDESYHVPIFSRSRWKKVRPVLEGYCPMLEDPSVRRRRQAYARRDVTTRTETWVGPLIRSGKLRDPEQFTLESVCEPDPIEVAGTP